MSYIDNALAMFNGTSYETDDGHDPRVIQGPLRKLMRQGPGQQLPTIRVYTGVGAEFNDNGFGLSGGRVTEHGNGSPEHKYWERTYDGVTPGSLARMLSMNEGLEKVVVSTRRINPNFHW